MMDFFKQFREIWNKITEFIGINNGTDFVQNNLFDEEYIRANIFRNTNFVKSNCYKDELIIILHSVVNNNLTLNNYANKNAIKIF